MPVVSIRFSDPAIHDRLRTAADRSGLSMSALSQQLIDEGLRMRVHPSIVFRDGPAGRRPALARGPDVADAIGAMVGGDVPPAQRRDRVAELLDLAPAQVDAALTVDEVPEDIAAYEGWEDPDDENTPDGVLGINSIAVRYQPIGQQELPWIELDGLFSGEESEAQIEWRVREIDRRGHFSLPIYEVAEDLDITPAEALRVYTVTHEYGHTAHRMLQRQMFTGPESRGEADWPNVDYFNELTDLLKEWEVFPGSTVWKPSFAGGTVGMDPWVIQEYAGSYATNNIHEFLAEMWTQYHLSPVPSDLAMDVGKLMSDAVENFIANDDEWA